jgi:hypothetical protein
VNTCTRLPHLGLACLERAAQRSVETCADFTTRLSSGVFVGDVSIVHPAGPSFAAAPATTTGLAERNQDAHKRVHYARRDRGGGHELVPVSVGSFERLGVPAYALLPYVADVAAGDASVFTAAFI